MSQEVSLSEPELAVWRGFLRVHEELVAELDEELRRERGMPLATYDVLVQLSFAPGRRLRMRELADAVLLSRSGLTRLVDRLVREGLVAREPCPDDARGAFAALTPAGAQALRRARPVHLAGVRRLFLDRLSTTQQSALADAWDRLRAGERPGAGG